MNLLQNRKLYNLNWLFLLHIYWRRFFFLYHIQLFFFLAYEVTHFTSICRKDLISQKNIPTEHFK